MSTNKKSKAKELVINPIDTVDLFSYEQTAPYDLWRCPYCNYNNQDPDASGHTDKLLQCYNCDILLMIKGPGEEPCH